MLDEEEEEERNPKDKKKPQKKSKEWREVPLSVSVTLLYFSSLEATSIFTLLSLYSFVFSLILCFVTDIQGEL